MRRHPAERPAGTRSWPVGVGLALGEAHFMGDVHMLFSRTDVKFQGRPQRPEFITESEWGKESPPRGKREEKAVSLKGAPREPIPPGSSGPKAPPDLI